MCDATNTRLGPACRTRYPIEIINTPLDRPCRMNNLSCKNATQVALKTVIHRTVDEIGRQLCAAPRQTPERLEASGTEKSAVATSVAVRAQHDAGGPAGVASAAIAAGLAVEGRSAERTAATCHLRKRRSIQGLRPKLSTFLGHAQRHSTLRAHRKSPKRRHRPVLWDRN